MNAEIELLDEPEVSTALTVTARAALALSSEKTRDELKALVAKSANIKEVRNAIGRDECHGAAMALVRARTTITKTGKAAREDAAAFVKAVISEEKSLIAITELEEARLLALRDAWDQARAAEKAEAERIERERITTIHLRIADIREVGSLSLQCRTSEAVQSLIDRMSALTLDGYDEFTEEAQNARADTLTRMQEIHAIKLAEETERARIKAEQQAEAERLAVVRAELDLLRKEAAERERIAAQERAEQEAKAQAARDAEAKKLADERAAFEAEQATARAAAQLLADTLAQERADLEAAIAKRDSEALAAAQPVVAPEPVAALPAEEFIFDQPDGSDDIDGPTEPSDADVIAVAATAVADKFGIPFNDALNRLAEIQEWIAVETT